MWTNRVGIGTRVDQLASIGLEQPFVVRTGASVLTFARRKPLGAAGGVLILGMIFTAVFAGVIAPYDPIARQPDALLAPPSATYWFGGDQLGRDLLSRVIWGSRISLWVGMVAVGVGTTIGTLVGLVSGYWAGKLDLALQRLMDMLQAFPSLLLALFIVAMLGNSTTNVMIALAVVSIPGTSRIVRGAVLAVKENQFVDSARAIGCGDVRILGVHILPNVLAPIIVIATIGLGSAIIAEAALSFLGLGTQPPTPSWGQMLSSTARTYMVTAPWLGVFPGLAMSLAVLGFNLLGDALRDVLDPRLRGTELRS